MERYFCKDCEAVFYPGRRSLPKSGGSDVCPFCRSVFITPWEHGEPISNYYGKLPVDPYEAGFIKGLSHNIAGQTATIAY